MKPLLFATLSFLSLQLVAQSEHTNWFSQIEEAQAYASEHEVPILMVFAGSDWCRPCIQFKQDILLSPDFENYAAEHLAILYLDFPARRKNQLPEEQTKHNERLAEQYNSSGAFPKLVLLSAKEEVLQEPTFHSQTPAVFIEEITVVKTNPE